MNNKNIISNKFDLNWSTTFSYTWLTFSVLPFMGNNQNYARRAVPVSIKVLFTQARKHYMLSLSPAVAI
jgi:hypothetical protein